MTDAPVLPHPIRVTVFGPGTPYGWRAAGRVTKLAPYSIHCEWEGPMGDDRGWFVWEPGRPNHARQHGVNADHGLRIEAAA